MTYFIGGFLMALWFVIFMAFSWSKSSSVAVNLFMGFVSYAIIGAFYIVPVWLVFWR